MVICLISQEYPPETNLGGIATYTQTLARQLVKMGQKVHVLTYAKEKEYVIDDMGVTVHRLLPTLKGDLDDQQRSLLEPYTKSSHWILGFSQRVYQYFLSLHEKEPFDVIEAPDTCAQALFIFKFVEGPKKIVRLHTPFFWVRHLNNIPDSPENSVRESLEKEQAFAATDVTSPTHALAEIVKQEWGINNIPVIPNFFNLDNYQPDLTIYDQYLKDQAYLIYYGRFEYRKGVHVLAPALREVLARHPSLKIAFVGDDSMYNDLSMKAGIQEVLQDFSDRVVFIPNVPHNCLYPLIERAKFVVLPSLWENFPYTCLEGMSLGKAVIATTGSGFSEIIDDGANGFLCAPGDANALCERILNCLDRSDIATIGARAAAKVKVFDNDLVVGRMLDYYRSSLTTAKRKLTFLYPTSMFPKLSETFILEQITSLIDLGHNVKIVAFWRSDETIFHPQIAKYGLLAKTLYIRKLETEPGFEVTPEVRDFLKDVDIIHSHFAALPTDFAMHVSKLMNIPFVFTTHAYDIFVHTRADKLAAYADSAARILTVTQFNKRFMTGMIGDGYRDKIEIIRCGIDVGRFSPRERTPADTVTILTTGRFVEKKGIGYAVRAMAQLQGRCKAVLRVVGDGPLRGEIEQAIAELHLEDRVLLLGALPQSEVIGEMQRADIFVLPSVTAANNDCEGLPVSILEAQAMKLPVVSTFHTGIPEGVIEGKTGFLVPERDVDALAASLLVLVKDPDLRFRMGEEGRRHVQRSFNMSNEVTKLEKILADCSEAGLPSIALHHEAEAAVSSKAAGVTEGKIKILFVAHSPYFFGAEQSFLALLEGLNRHRFEPVVSLPGNVPGGILQSRLNSLGIKTYIIESPERWIDFAVNCDPLDGLLEEAYTVDAYREIIANERVDLVYTNTITKISGALAAKLCNIPHIYHVREVLEDHPLTSAFADSTTFNMISFLSDHIVTNSRFVAHYFNRLCSRDQIHTVYNAIESNQSSAKRQRSGFRDELKIEWDTPLIGIIGTVHSHKNHQDLIHALAVLKKNRFDAKLVVIGHIIQDYHAHLIRLIEEYDLKDRIIFVPFRNDIQDIIHDLDLVVVCSLAEPFGRTTIEAMAAGIPVVATDTGASPEIVVDGVTGYLVPLHDAEKLAEAIVKVLSDPLKAKEMGRAGRQQVAEVFNMRNYLNGVETILEETFLQTGSRRSQGPVDVDVLISGLKGIISVPELGIVRRRFHEMSETIRKQPDHQYDKGTGKALIAGLFESSLAPATTEFPVSKSAASNAPEEHDSPAFQPASLRLIAMYLPQYHPIPENDEWWGKGFTEWRNVAKAKPLFDGHYQPHVPADLGFYDLRAEETRIAQAELAREYGVHGFCYYHYWFNGKRLLERPLEEALKSGKPDFPFCICWANENWTRRWDGEEQHVLMKQVYSEEDDREHIRDLFRIFEDPRYIRVDGKPVFLVYRTENIPDPARTAGIWREEARRAGIGELYLVRVESIGGSDPTLINFDAALEFAPDWKLKGPRVMSEQGQASSATEQLSEVYRKNYVHSYDHLASEMMAKPVPDYTWFRCVTPSWDNSARRQEGANIFVGSTPEKYGQWLDHVVTYTKKNRSGDERIAFVNAWNEWAEGNHLEPDQRVGRAYLEATKGVIDRQENNKQLLPETEFIDMPRSEEELFELQRQLAAAQRQNGELNEQVSTLRRQLATKEQQLSLRDLRIEELLTSASWRLTGPLRKVYEVLNKLKGKK